MYACMEVGTHVRMHVCMHVSTYIYKCVYTWLRPYVSPWYAWGCIEMRNYCVNYEGIREIEVDLYRLKRTKPSPCGDGGGGALCGFL